MQLVPALLLGLNFLHLIKSRRFMEAVLEKLSEYELERGKPIPSLNHGIIQLNLGSLLKFKYKVEFTVAKMPKGYRQL